MHEILAIDMGKNKSVICRYASGNAAHQFGSLATSPKDFEALLKRHPGCRVVI